MSDPKATRGVHLRARLHPRELRHDPPRAYATLFVLALAVFAAVGLVLFWIAQLFPATRETLVGVINPRTLFFRNGDDRFMDFFNSVCDAAQGMDAYTVRSVIYPPLANLFYIVMAFFLPRWYCDTPFRDRGLAVHTPACMTLIGVVTVLELLLIGVLCYFALRGTRRDLRIVLTLCMTCSFPLLFLLERGNILVLSFALVLVFFLLREHPNRILRELALVALAAASAIKLYPIVFGLFLLTERRWRELLRCAVYGVLFLCLPALAVGNPLEVFHSIAENLLSFFAWTGSGGGRSSFPSYRSVTAWLRKLCSLIASHSVRFPLPLTLLLFAAQVGVYLRYFFSARAAYKRWIAAIGLFLLLPGAASIYALVFFLIPFLSYLREVRELKGMDAAWFGFFLLIFVPIPIAILSPWSISVRITAYMTAPLLLALCLADMLSRRRKPSTRAKAYEDSFC